MSSAAHTAFSILAVDQAEVHLRHCLQTIQLCQPTVVIKQPPVEQQRLD